jgi:hypothetical protein
MAAGRSSSPPWGSVAGPHPTQSAFRVCGVRLLKAVLEGHEDRRDRECCTPVTHGSRGPRAWDNYRFLGRQTRRALSRAPGPDDTLRDAGKGASEVVALYSGNTECLLLCDAGPMLFLGHLSSLYLVTQLRLWVLYTRIDEAHPTRRMHARDPRAADSRVRLHPIPLPPAVVPTWLMSLAKACWSWNKKFGQLFKLSS